MAFIDGLCDVCEKIITSNDEDSWTLPHHSSIQDLVKAASLGCQLCSLLWNNFSEQEKLQVRSRRSLFSKFFVRPSQISCHLEKEPKVQPDISCDFEFRVRSGRNVRKNLKFKYLKESPNPLPLERDASTGSIASLEWAKRWINKCFQEHSICGEEPNSARKLPSRLVWVGLSEADQIRLCDTQSLPPDTKYVTLSHRWGSKEFLKLTTAEIDHFRERIPSSELPKTFQDAIVVTRFMAIRYIWIDSLCIIQNSKSDWETESLLMKDVYLNGYFNIAASHAADSEGKGCFMARGNECTSFTIDIPHQGRKVHPWFSPGRYMCTYVDPDAEAELWSAEVTNSNLLQRAWVLQERLLSQRVLYFTSSRIFFECKNSRACDLFLDEDIELRYRQTSWMLLDNFKTRIHSLLTKALSTPPDERVQTSRAQTARIVWMWIVNNFSTCQLTRESDRLVAIAGLAHYIQPLLDCRYLAGLWEDDLVVQLLWHKEGKSQPTETYQAPSWSWASKIGRTIMYHHGMSDLADTRPTYHDQEVVVREMIKICEAEVATTDNNPLGQVTHGRLRMKGILIPIMLDSIELHLPSDPTGRRPTRSVTARDVKFVLQPDISGEILVGRYSCAMCLQTDLYFGCVSTLVQGLLLKATGKEKGQYERVGLLTTSAHNDSINPVVVGSGGGQAEKAMMTHEFYEEYYEATGEYTFSVI